MSPIRVTADPLDIQLDARELAGLLADTLGEHYAAQLDKGQRPEGGALPLNSKGQPLGRGSGTISRNWVTTPPEGDASQAMATTGPYQEGGYAYAVRAMVVRGASPVSVEGKADAMIGAVVQRYADKVVK